MEESNAVSRVITTTLTNLEGSNPTQGKSLRSAKHRSNLFSTETATLSLCSSSQRQNPLWSLQGSEATEAIFETSGNSIEFAPPRLLAGSR